jgi:hypothetical protein
VRQVVHQSPGWRARLDLFPCAAIALFLRFPRSLTLPPPATVVLAGGAEQRKSGRRQ